MNEDIEKLFISDKNTELWEKMSNKYDVQIEISCFQSGIRMSDDCRFLININKDDIKNHLGEEVFTHELLHLYVLNEIFFVLDEIEKLRNKSTILKCYLPDESLRHIHNILSHIIMCPIYIKLGYNKSVFAGIDDCLLNNLTNRLSVLKFNDLFSFKFLMLDYIMAMLDLKNMELTGKNICKFYNILESNDYELFSVINTNLHKWETLNSRSDFKQCLENFMCSIEKYIIDKEAVFCE